jgi:hypothetical protein
MVQAALKTGPATLTISLHPEAHDSRRKTLSSCSLIPTWLQNALALPSARATSAQMRAEDWAAAPAGTWGAVAARVRSEAVAVRRRRVARPWRRKAGRTPRASTWTSRGRGAEAEMPLREDEVRSEVGTWSAAAMQPMMGPGLSEVGRVAMRQRCVWCVRSWWKNVGRSAGKDGASSAWEERKREEWLLLFAALVGGGKRRGRSGLGLTCNARTFWMSAEVRGRMMRSSTDHCVGGAGILETDVFSMAMRS